MRRRLARLVLVTLLGSAALLLGVVTEMTLTPPGRDLLARTTVQVLNGRVHGRVEIGAISGSFLHDLSFRQLVVRDSAGDLLADVPSLRIGFRLPQLAARRFVFTRLVLDRPDVRIVKRRNGRMNYEEVFGLGGPAGGPPSAPPLVQFFDVEIHGGTVRIAVPWDPPAAARTPAQRDAALAAERAKPGRQVVQGREGLEKLTTVSGLEARLPFALVSSPERKPITIRMDALALVLSEPAIRLVDAGGQVEVRGDSLSFQLERLQLPNTFAVGGGVVSWPHDTLLLDFRMNAPRVDLADLRFITPDFPAMTGRASVVAKSESGSRGTFAIRDLMLAAPGERIDGDLVAVVDAKRGLGVRGLDLQLTDVDLAHVTPFIPALPFRGRLSGRTRADGYLSALDADVDWSFADADVPGRPVSAVAGTGHLRTGGAEGLVFDGFTVHSSAIDLRTVRRFAPVVPLGGTVSAAGTLDGALRNAQFTGVVRHHEGSLPASTADGRFRLDTRGKEVAFDVDAELAELAFDGIRPGFPGLGAQGTLAGHVAAAGTASRFTAQADVHGALGAIEGGGVFTTGPGRVGADSVDVRIRDLDLALLRGTGPATRLTGRLGGHGEADRAAAAPAGAGRLELAPGRAGPVAFDTLVAAAAIANGLITLDSARAGWGGLHLQAAGTLGWARPVTGHLVLSLAADTLAALDSALASRLGMPQDTVADSRILAGALRGTLTLDGALDSLDADGTAAADGLEFRRWRLPSVAARLGWNGGAVPTLAVTARADSVRNGEKIYRRLLADARGPLNLLAWEARATVGEGSTLDALGRWWPRMQPGIVAVDTLAAGLAVHDWVLESPVAITLNDSAQAITPIALRATDGSGSIDVVGRIPGATEGGLTLGIRGVDLRDLYGLLQRDTAEASGTFSLLGDVGGTAADPTVQGSLALETLRIGDARLPFAQGALNYARKQLEVDLKLWKAGASVFDVHADVPFDLAWRGAGDRRVDGPLEVRAHTDSVDLAIFEAISPSVRNVKGTLVADARVDGTWKAPRLQGFAEVKDGALLVVPLGTRFPRVQGRLELAGDSLTLQGVRAQSVQGGTLDVAGRIRFRNLAEPTVDLQLVAERFKAIDARQFLTLTGTGRLKLTGPLLGSTLTGNITATDTDLYFADIVNKRLFDIDDPAFADLADSTSAERQLLRRAAPSRFFDALNVRDLAVSIGSNTHLRSGEADIVIEGDLRANKQRKAYRFDGTAHAVRGRYSLAIGSFGGLATRDFSVEQGTVRYTGTPDLNADLDIQARHVVRTLKGEQIPVIARITGTLYTPKVALTTDGERQYSEADLTAYLVLGSSVGDLNVGQSGLFAGATLFNTLLGQLAGSAKLPFDVFEVRVGAGAGKSASSQYQITVGKQIGAKTFLLGSTFLCQTSGSPIDPKFGASLQYRFNRTLRAQFGIEPQKQFCAVNSSFLQTAQGYQFGADIFYEKEF